MAFAVIGLSFCRFNTKNEIPLETLNNKLKGVFDARNNAAGVNDAPSVTPDQLDVTYNIRNQLQECSPRQLRANRWEQYIFQYPARAKVPDVAISYREYVATRHGSGGAWHGKSL
jgi:hypothetical protein